MTLAERTFEYARTHLQSVSIVWLDREPEMVDAVKAVELCQTSMVSGHIIAAVAQDKKLEDLLNQLIDED